MSESAAARTSENTPATRDTGSAVRAGVVHYNNRSDVDRLLAAVAEMAG